MSTLYLVRHGQASIQQQQLDRLSGRRQVALLRDHFDARGVALDGLWSGRLRRQLDTAQILGAPRAAARGAARLRRVPRRVRGAGLARRRRGAGRRAPALASAPQSGSARDYQRLLEGAGRAWVRGELPGYAGESLQQFRARVGDALDAVMRAAGRGRQVAVCTSAGVIGAAVGHVLGLDDLQSMTLSWSIHNASVTVLLFDERRASLSSISTPCHTWSARDSRG